MSSKKVYFLIWSDSPGGIEVTLPELITYFPQYKFSAYILRSKKKTTVSVFEKSDIEIHYGPSNNFVLYFKLFCFARDNKSGIIHGFNIGPIVLFTLRLANVKRIIYSIRGSIYWKTKSQKIIRRFFWKLAFSNKVVFTANSEYSKKIFLEKVVAKPQIKVLYNPFDTNKFKLKRTREADLKRLKICYVGRLVKGKNLFKWIETAGRILKTFPGFEFNIYGDGPQRKDLELFIQKKKLGNKIQLREFKKDIENAYKENDLLLFLSQYESFGNVVVESILCGTPVIASRIPSMEEIFKDYPEFLVNLDEDLSDSVITNLNNYSSLKSGTLKAANEFKDRFSLVRHISELERIYNSFE